MSRKKSNQLNPAESKDQMITKLIQQRKLQQGALLKIMDSIEKEKEELPDPVNEEMPYRKRVIKKIFNSDKKSKQK